jgi:recombination protein RecA
VGGYVTPAGYALRHWTILRIYLSKGKAIEEPNRTNPVGQYVKFIIKKNQLSKPHRQAETNIYYETGINYFLDVLKFAGMLGVVKSRGSYYVFEETNLGQGIKNALKTLESEPELLDKIVKMCYNISGVEVKSTIKDETDEQDN